MVKELVHCVHSMVIIVYEPKTFLSQRIRIVSNMDTQWAIIGDFNKLIQMTVNKESEHGLIISGTLLRVSLRIFDVIIKISLLEWVLLYSQKIIFNFNCQLSLFLWFESEWSPEATCGHGREAFQRWLNIQFLISSWSTAGIWGVSATCSLRQVSGIQYKGEKEASPCILLLLILSTTWTVAPLSHHPSLEPADCGQTLLQTVKVDNLFSFNLQFWMFSHLEK